MNPAFDTWDPYIAEWLTGGPSVPRHLDAWWRSNSGQGRAAPVPEALPEPWFGHRTAPAMVFLALNPGQPFLGEELWHQELQLPDLQSRHGVFANEIRAIGTYSRWATRFPEWSRWVPGGNGFYEARFRFARDWTGNGRLAGDDCLLLELYPWHSRSFNAGAFRPGREALEQIDLHVLRPIHRLPPATPVFAFGSPWFKVLPRLRFDELKRWSVSDGHRLGAVRDRTVSIFQQGALRIVAEKHAGGAGPPKAADVWALRELLGPHLG